MDFNEFEESEVIFSDYSSDDSVESDESESENDDETWEHCSESTGSRLMVKRRESLKKRIRVSSTLVSPFQCDHDVSNYDTFEEDAYDDDDHYDNNNDDRKMTLPPHLIVAKRVNEEMARSFSPIKGKNLCEVRNSILRMTGFLER